jgi:hypothetical protein
MNGGAKRLSPRPWRTIASYLAGIAVEALYTLGLAGIGALIVLGLRMLYR